MDDVGGVAAGIVAFRPAPEQLTALVRTLRADTARVYVFFNSPIAPALRSELARDATLIGPQQNLGIGAALNGIVATAREAGFDDVILFDQDSQPDPGIARRLTTIRAHLHAAGQRPAVVTPYLVAAPGSGGKPPTYRPRRGLPSTVEAQAVAFVPTSGSLISLEALRDIGPFRADYFIDGVDLEWCFRAWARGWSCWVAPGCTMAHNIGTGVIGWGRVGFAMPKQQPFRMYCTVRNAIYGLRLGHVPLGWKAKQVAYLPVQIAAYALHHRLRWSILAQLGAGLRDGIAGRLGPPPGLS